MPKPRKHDLHEENPFLLSEVGKHYDGITKKQVRYWVERGLAVKDGSGKRVKLETCLIGDWLATSVPALVRFFKRVAGESQ